MVPGDTKYSLIMLVDDSDVDEDDSEGEDDEEDGMDDD